MHNFDLSTSTPSQKISSYKKGKQWYINNLETACKKTRVDSTYYNTWKNQQENYLLSIGILDLKRLECEVDLQGLSLSNMPIKLRHIGIGNSKLNVLLGDFYGRQIDYACTVSAKDEESVTRKEKDFTSQLTQKLAALAQSNFDNGYIDEKKLEEEIKKIEYWSTYEFQDIAEITANKLLKYEVLKTDAIYRLSEGFKNLLIRGKAVFLIDDYNGEVVFEPVDPACVTSWGGDSKWIHEKDYIMIERYRSIGQLYDSYYNDFSALDRTKIENYQKGEFGASYSLPVVQPGFLIDQNDYANIFTGTNEPNNMFVGKPSEFEGILREGGIITNKPYFSNNGELLETTVFWRSKRKIIELTQLDENGIPVVTFIGEGYIPDEFKGESIKEIWVNEWCRCTKIAEDIFVKYGPVKGTAKSLTNLSYGLPPIIGVEVEQSMFDIIKHIDLDYDKAFWKRSLLVAQLQGTKTAVNAAMVPEGYDPKMWLAMSNVDQILLLDPTREILTGPFSGKIAAQATNTFVTQEINMGGNYQQIQALSDYMVQLEYTMGKICGVNGTREGEIGERQAVRNTQFEMTQFSKVTEHWFQLYDRLIKTCFKKLLEVCKYVYKDNPIKGSYLFNDFGQEFIQNYTEFAETEFDIHTNRPTEDKELFDRLKTSVDQALQQGRGSYDDYIAIHSSNSVQLVAKKLRDNAQKIREEQAALQKQQEDSVAKLEQMRLIEAQKLRDHEIELKEMDIAIKKYEIDSRSNQESSNLDLVNDNELDLADIHFKNKDLAERVRHNKMTENLTKEKNSISRIQKRTPQKN